jgi:hypothetical protein
MNLKKRTLQKIVEVTRFIATFHYTRLKAESQQALKTLSEDLRHILALGLLIKYF